MEATRKRKLGWAIVGLAVFSIILPTLDGDVEATAIQALLLAALQVREEKRFRSDGQFWDMYENADVVDWYKGNMEYHI